MNSASVRSISFSGLLIFVYTYIHSLHVLYSYTERGCTNHITKLLSAHVAMDCIGSKNYVLLSVLKHLIYCIITLYVCVYT